MFNEQRDWAHLYDELGKKIRNKQTAAEALELALKMHTSVHFKSMLPQSGIETFWDEVCEGLTDKDFTALPIRRKNTIAWSLWHLTRIEDIVSNILINNGNQIFNTEWQAAIGSDITDTANAMTDAEMREFSKRLNIKELINYSDTVGRSTQEIIRSMTHDKLKQKPSAESLDRIVTEGVLTQHKNSIWLKRFWGNLTIAGLVRIPLTHHHVMHLNEAVKIREKLKGSL